MVGIGVLQVVSGKTLKLSIFFQPPFCSTPIHSNGLPALEFVTPKAGAICFVCGSSSKGNLVYIISNAAVPEASMVVSDFRECFGLNILGDENVVNRKICRYCKRKLAAAMQLKRAAMSGLDGSTQRSEPLVHSMGASPLISTIKSSPVPHQVPTEHQYHRQKNVSDAAGEMVRQSSQKTLSSLSDSSSSFKERESLIQSLQHDTSYKQTAKLITGIPALVEAIEIELLGEIHEICDKLCSVNREPGPSVLRTLSQPASLMKDDILSESAVELNRCLPFAFKVLTALCTPLHTEKPNTKHTIGMMYAMAMHNRNYQLSAAQKLNTAAAVRYHANNDLLSVFHKIGITMAEGSKLNLLDQLGDFNMDGLVHSLKKRIPGKITMDNIDGMLMANQIRLGSGNKHYHYAASTYYVDRCDVSHLPMVQPQLPDVLSPDVLFLNNEEELNLKRNYGYQVMGVVIRCRQTSNIRCILVCNKIVDHSDVGTAPITS